MSDHFRVGDAAAAGYDDDAAEGPAERVDLFAPPSGDELAAGPSVLEALQEALASPVDSVPSVIRVPARKGITIRCHTRMQQEQRKAWQKRATRKRRGVEEVDEMLFAQLVLANTMEAICVNGVDAHDAEGTPLTFAHRQLWEMVGATNPPDCIRALFVKDAHVLLASGQVLIDSGFDDDLEADPTQG